MNDIWQLLIAPHDQIIVYSFDPAISIRFLNAINKVLQKRVVMFRHGSMEMLQCNPSGKGAFYNFEKKLVRQFFLNKNIRINENIHFFVLGDVILKNLSFLLSKDKMKHFSVIDHPYNFDKNTLTKERSKILNYILVPLVFLINIKVVMIYCN